MFLDIFYRSTVLLLFLNKKDIYLQSFYFFFIFLFFCNFKCFIKKSMHEASGSNCSHFLLKFRNDIKSICRNKFQ